MDRDEALTKIELEMILQIAQTQRATLLLLDQTTRFLGDLIRRPAINEAAREAQWKATVEAVNENLKAAVENINTQVKAAETRLESSVRRQIDVAMGNHRYWEMAVSNLQSEVATLIRRRGENRDTEAIDGIFKG